MLEDGRPAPDGTAGDDLFFPCCFRDSSEIRPRPARDGVTAPDARGVAAASGDRLIRLAAAAVVCVMAGFAAVVSYSHIYGHTSRPQPAAPPAAAT